MNIEDDFLYHYLQKHNQELPIVGGDIQFELDINEVDDIPDEVDSSPLLEITNDDDDQSPLLISGSGNEDRCDFKGQLRKLLSSIVL